MGGDSEDGPCVMLGSAPRRIVIRGRNDETGHSQIFSALISCEDVAPFRPHDPEMLVTLWLAGDNVTDYLHGGGRFDLWLGHDVGRGIVTRRLFV